MRAVRGERALEGKNRRSQRDISPETMGHCPFALFSRGFRLRRLGDRQKTKGTERGASFAPNSHWADSEARSDAYLAVALEYAKAHAALRDKYVPGSPMWVTESGDAGAGGNTWASTYLDVLRTLNELGSFAAITDGVIFHNTLARCLERASE